MSNRKQKKLTPTQVAAAAADIARGAGKYETAKKYGVHYNTLYRMLRGDDWKPKELKPCGTDAAYQRHLAKKEVPDELCLKAHRDYMNGYRNTAESAVEKSS